MLVQGTQMHIITFIFVIIEIVILFYLVIYRIARPDDKTTYLNITLIFLLITYNITGGLLPDTNLPGSYFLQESLAYATGFITPCYFPYYVLKAFSLEKMKFQAYRGVYIFLILPYVIFVIVFAYTGKLDIAKDLLILPVFYAVWVIISLVKAIRYKYANDFSSKESKEEFIVLLLSLTPWVMLPAIDFFDLGQATEVCITNLGFLSLFAFQMKRHIKEMHTEQERLVTSEKQLLNWNTSLKFEVDKRTKELEMINEQRTNTFVNLAHETKTPLTLINNYLEEYINKNDPSEELSIVKRNLDKLSFDIVNLFDLEKFNKGFAVYNHNSISNFSDLLKDSVLLFKQYAARSAINITADIEDGILLNADSMAINRIINNLIENAIKFSTTESFIEIKLRKSDETFQFIVKDSGYGIPIDMHGLVFEPYYQIANSKINTQGMGLGLPIVKKVIDDLNGTIQIISDPGVFKETEVIVILNHCDMASAETEMLLSVPNMATIIREQLKIEDAFYDEQKQTVFIIEDNTTMLHYLNKKISEKYNTYTSVNGNDALKKMKGLSVLPDLIITDIMMDKMDGHDFAKIISKTSSYSHIPFMFLTAKGAPNDKLNGLKLGAIDYISKPFSIAELLQKIDSVLQLSAKQKKTIWNKAFSQLNLNDNASLKSSSLIFEQNCELYQLTAREKDIAKLICQGQKYKDIGDKLYIAERTVTKHSQNIFEKLKVSSKIELINKLGLS